MPQDPIALLQKLGEHVADLKDLDPQARLMIVQGIGELMGRVAGVPSEEEVADRGSVPVDYRPPAPPPFLGGPPPTQAEMARSFETWGTFMKSLGLEIVIRPSNAGRA
jgi:hypothetical protein